MHCLVQAAEGPEVIGDGTMQTARTRNNTQTLLVGAPTPQMSPTAPCPLRERGMGQSRGARSVRGGICASGCHGWLWLVLR